MAVTAPTGHPLAPPLCLVMDKMVSSPPGSTTLLCLWQENKTKASLCSSAQCNSATPPHVNILHEKHSGWHSLFSYRPEKHSATKSHYLNPSEMGTSATTCFYGLVLTLLLATRGQSDPKITGRINRLLRLKKSFLCQIYHVCTLIVFSNSVYLFTVSLVS